MFFKAKKRKVANSYVVTLPPVIAQNMEEGKKYKFEFEDKQEVD